MSATRRHLRLTMARNLPTIDKPKLAPAPTICRLRNEAVLMINNIG
jgi:hypothetical protein